MDYGKLALPRNRFKFGLPFCVISVLFLALVAYQIFVSKRMAHESAMTDANNLTLVLESKLNVDFAAAERTVSAMVAEIDPDAMRPEAVSRYKPQVTSWLKSHVGAISSASGLRYFNANGDRLYTSTDSESPLNVSDKAHFQQLKADPTIPIIFSDVAFGRATGRVSMYVAKAVRGKDGAFLGTATTAIDLTSLHEHFRSIEIGKEGVVTLRRLDNGASVVRFPGPVEVNNKPTPDLPVRHAILKDGRGGVMDITSRIDGSRRIYGYRQVGTFPFFVAVGIADSDYLAQWRRDSTLLLFGSLFFLAALAGVFYWLAVIESRRNKSEIALRESESRFKHLTEMSSDWYWEQDENFRFTFVSQGYYDVIGSEGTVLGKTRWELPHAGTDPQFMQEHDAWLATHKPIKDVVITRIDRNDQIHYTQISGAPVFDDDGRFSGYRGVSKDITERVRQERQISDTNAQLVHQKAELEATLARVKGLEGILSICMQCKKIRAEDSDWQQLERYIGEHSDAVFSHGLCPDCLGKAMQKLD